MPRTKRRRCGVWPPIGPSPTTSSPRSGGRIFNTAGDAVLAEFPSAVEAVRCAIDIQESLRTRNMAYPPSRQMSFRIGITIGDVVERDGDLLGDGVNIAARLEGLAEVGGICISRAVHEQVANKLSVQFADIGAQEVKNIPTPVHAYMVAMRREDGTYATPQVKKPAPADARGRAELDVAGRGDGGVSGRDRRRRLSVFHQDWRCGTRPRRLASASNAMPLRRHRRRQRRSGRRRRQRRRHPLRRRRIHRAKSSRPRPCRSSAIESVSFWRTNMSPAADYKAFALNVNGIIGLVSGAAERRSREKCRARAMPEARRRRSVAAKMRNLCRRQHGGLSAWPAAGAALAVDQARSLDREAVRGKGHAAGARSRKGQA